jgi:hypothetical protein
MTDLKTIRAQIRALQRQEEELVAAGFQERLPAIRALKDKTFVEHFPPQWDTYFKVIEIVETKYPYAWAICEELVIDTDGKVAISLKARRVYTIESVWQIACDPDEYDLMRSAALETLADPVVLREYLAKETK